MIRMAEDSPTRRTVLMGMAAASGAAGTTIRIGMDGLDEAA